MHIGIRNIPGTLDVDAIIESSAGAGIPPEVCTAWHREATDPNPKAAASATAGGIARTGAAPRVKAR